MRSFDKIAELVRASRDGLVLQTGGDGLACKIGPLRIIASIGGGWDHVSVSRAVGLPTYADVQMVKRMFFNSSEWAMELHAPVASHINIHPNTLHLWRPQWMEIPTPPEWMV